MNILVSVWFSFVCCVTVESQIKAAEPELSSLGATLKPASTRSPTAPGELRSYSTMHSIGIEWDIERDADHDAVCKVQHRIGGSGAWKEALPLFRVDYHGWYADTKADRAYNLFAGSVLFLQPGTAYEVRLQLSDPDGGANTKTLKAQTRPMPSLPQGGRTLHVVPGSGGGAGSADDSFRGLAAAQAAARAGDVLHLHGGRYGQFTFDKSGEAGRYLVWKAARDGEVLFEEISVAASHVWLEGLTLKRAAQSNGLRARGAASDVVVSRNHFEGFHYSILLNKESRDWHIADNVIAGDNDPITGGISGEGIELNHSSGHVVCYNRLSRTADGVSYPHRDCDIFGNDIFDVSDDGLEPDYGYANNRMWGNRITNAKHAAFSFQPMYCGPWYFIRNQVIGEASAFKFRVQDRFLLAHNTFVRWGAMDTRMHLLLTAFSRNNLFISASDKEPVWTAFYYRDDQKGSPYVILRSFKPDWRTDVDYDGFDWGNSKNAFRWDDGKLAYFPDLSSFSATVGIEQHGRRVRKEEIFGTWNIPNQPARIEPQALLTLNPNGNAIDGGAVIPNISEEFSGNAPDLGAYEFGRPAPHYGPRP